MKKGVIYIVILAIVCLVAGVVLGTFLEKRYMTNQFRHAIKERIQQRQKQMADPEVQKKFREDRQTKAKERILDRLNEELALSDEQVQEVKAIIESTEKEIHTLGEEIKTKFTEVREQGNEKILEILNPEQQEKFKTLVQEQEKRKQEWMQKRSGPLPPR